jgi:hypothetical protein
MVQVRNATMLFLWNSHILRRKIESVNFKANFGSSPRSRYRQLPLVTGRHDIEIGCYVCVAASNCSLCIYQIIGEFLHPPPPLIKSLATKVQVQRSMSIFA